MSRNSAKGFFIAALSYFTIGATPSLHTVEAEDVTEEPILKAPTRERRARQ